MSPAPAARDASAILWFLAGLVAVLSVLPLARLALEALAPGGVPSLAALAETFSRPATWIAFRNSIEIAIGGTVLAVTFGGAVALAVGLTDIRARQAFVFAFVTPLMIAPQVTALAWLQLFGPGSPILALVGIHPPIGWRNPLYSREGIVLLLAVQYSPLVFLTLRAGLRSLPRELVEAARAAGAGRFAILKDIVLPLMGPPLAAGTALVFVSCLGNFGIPAFLGIPGNFPVLPTLIYQRLAGLGPSVLAEVSVLSLLIGAVAVAGILAQDRLGGRRDVTTAGAGLRAAPFALGRVRLPVEALLWLVALAVLVMPIAGLVATSLVPAVGVPLGAATATVKNYTYVLFEHAASRRAFTNSLSLSLAAAALIVLIAIPFGHAVVWRRSRLMQWLRFAAELPYALPGVVLAIAAILLFLKPLPVVGFSLYNTVWIILFAYLARFLVLGLRPVVGGFHQVDRALEEAAQVAGARLPRRLLDIAAPLVAPAAAAGALLVFLTAFNELTVSALLWSSGAETLGVVVFGFEQGGETNAAAAMAVVTVAVTFALMLATLAFARRLPEGVLPWRD